MAARERDVSKEPGRDAPFAKAMRRLFGLRYTHAALAERLGLKNATEISHLANGVRNPSDRQLQALAREFPEHWPKLFAAAVRQKLEMGERPVVALPVDLTSRDRLNLALLLTWTWDKLSDDAAKKTTAFLLKVLREEGWEIPS